jgi:hypothetical protein
MVNNWRNDYNWSYEREQHHVGSQCDYGTNNWMEIFRAYLPFFIAAQCESNEFGLIKCEISYQFPIQQFHPLQT